jgi:anti-anti-sigma factor
MIKVESKRGHTILRILKDNDVSGRVAMELKNKIESYLEKDEIQSLILDLSKLYHMDSTMLRIMLLGHRIFGEKNKNYGLLGLSELHKEILELASLNNYFKIYTDEEELSDI